MLACQQADMAVIEQYNTRPCDDGQRGPIRHFACAPGRHYDAGP